MANKETENPTMLIVGTIATIIVVLGIFTLLFGSWYIINAGERGVVLTLGKPAETASTEGFHMKAPLVQRVVKMDIKTQIYEAHASAASKDLQVVSTNIAVNYHLLSDNLVTLYKEIGLDYGTKIIQPAVQEVVKASTAHYTAEELITKRALVKEDIDTALRERLLAKGIYMETTSITNFDFSAQFNAAIEQKVTAEQNALTAKNKLAQIEYEAQQTVAAAKGQRDASIASAEAQAKTIQLTAQAEAEKVRLIQQELSKSPNYVQYVQANRWDGKLPNYVMGGATPLLQMPLETK